MKVEEISEKEIWECFLFKCEEKTFLQSFNWGEFQKKMGNKIWRLGIYDKDKLAAVALIIKIVAKRGVFLFCPHGPAFVPFYGTSAGKPSLRYKALKILLEKLKKIAKEEKASFIRVSPVWENSRENTKVFENLGFRQAPIHMHPELTWELHIESLEEELLQNMRKTTRYLIRQAQKNKDINIYQSQELNDVEKFNELYQKTVNRHHFTPFSVDYLKNEVSSFLPDNQAMIFFGEYKEELITSAIVIFWQKIAFYHQGASSLKYPKIPVSYLLQWEAIREAKKRGCSVYNFWGIAPLENKKHPWAGLTLFKTGFGGYKKEYVRTQDFVLSKIYWLNYLVERLRRSKRGL